ncbi:MAG: FadR/GntR family transcriptional regulator, partial [Micromonosporaceae bacterium]
LDALVDRMAVDPGADKAFHTLLYETSGNDLVLQLIGLFWDVYRDVEPTIDPPKVAPGDIAANHRRIVEVLRTGDATAAQQAMQRHFAELQVRLAAATAS